MAPAPPSRSESGLDPLLDQRPLELSEGAENVVWKLDRLGRSLPHLLATVTDLKRRGIRLLASRTAPNPRREHFGGNVDAQQLRAIGNRPSGFQERPRRVIGNEPSGFQERPALPSS